MRAESAWVVTELAARSGSAAELSFFLQYFFSFFFNADVVELVDTLGSGSSGGNPVGVRVPPSAYLLIQ